MIFLDACFLCCVAVHVHDVSSRLSVFTETEEVGLFDQKHRDALLEEEQT